MIKLFAYTLLSLLFSSVVFSQQQILNGHFNSEPSGQITSSSLNGWDIVLNASNPMAKFYIDDESAQLGKSLKVEVLDLGVPYNPFNIAMSTAPSGYLSFNNGETVTYSFYAKADANSKQFRIKLRDSNNGNRVVKEFSLSDTFRKYTFETTYTETRDDYMLMFHLAMETGVFWIDELTIEDGSSGNDNVQQDCYVSSTLGSDNNPGTEILPFKTIQKAIGQLEPGKTCFVMEGEYHEELNISNINGSYNNPVTIKAYPSHQVQIKGTEVIDKVWSVHQGNIYKTSFANDIWQLFVDGDMVTSARWPNAHAWSEDMWSREQSWGHQDATSTYGTMVDDGTMNLAGQTEDFTGAIAILNVGSWLSFAEKVTSHGGNSGTFNYTTNFKEAQFHHKINHGSYFLEASLACLDAPNEWYYNSTTNELYLYTDDGQDPTGRLIQGKVSTYGLTIENSSYIQFKDIDFFASTIKLQNSNNCKIENCQVDYPSYSKRMLGSLTKAEPTVIDAGSSTNNSNNVLRNCSFQYADGTGLEIIGKNDTVDNCLFKHIDYSCVGSLHDVMVNARHANNLTFRYNTMSYGGNSVGIKMGLTNKVEYNLVSKQGMLQNDGAAIQADASESDGAVMSHNWVNNTIKFGIRFDSPWNNPSVYGTYGKMIYNVVWNSKPMIPKGDYHTIYNNTAFNNEGFDISIFSVEEHGGLNHNTLVRNNAVGSISGSNSSTLTPYNGIVENCWIGIELIPEKDILEQLNDAANNDYRPHVNSELIDNGHILQGVTDVFVGDFPDKGAYEFNDTNYWIPGRKESKASHPIPNDLGVSNSDTVDLIWREGYLSDSHMVYFGESLQAVQDANISSGEFLGEFKNNIISPGELVANKTYFWRIDNVVGEQVITGDVWSFTAGKDANDSVTGIFNKIDIQTLKVWPNPVSKTLNVVVPSKGPVVIQVYNMSGSLYYQTKSVGKDVFNIDVSEWPKGMYMIKIGSASSLIAKV
ncbi:T9SS type A sorting domain-containing protein [Labilibacter sediminis]|nr:T9SS type A sorting domain-containing protein [Labilibacter sediminis]